MKAKLNRADYQFRKRENEELIKIPGQINGIDFLIFGCENCTIWICDHTAQVQVQMCKNCKIYLGPSDTVVFVQKCENIEISSASQQFRISNSQNCKCFIFSESDPAVEKSQNILFAPFNFTYPQITQHFQDAKLSIDKDKWGQVYDFDLDSQDKNPFQHWNILQPDQYQQIKKEIDDLECEEIHPVPIPSQYGGTSTEPIIIISLDQQGDQPRQSLGELMSKSNVQKVEEDLYNAQNDEERSFKSNEAYENAQSFKTFSVFDEASQSGNQQKNYKYTFTKEKEDEEKVQKQERKDKAKEYLDKFMRELNQQIEQRRQLNRELSKENAVSKDRGNNSWQFIVKNVELKNYQGEKDKSQMIRALINKSQDQQQQQQ